MKTYIDIPDSGKESTPFVKLHFFKWLKENYPNLNEQSISNIDVKKAYLASVGVNPSEGQYVSPDDLLIIKHTLEFYFDVLCGKILNVEI